MAPMRAEVGVFASGETEALKANSGTGERAPGQGAGFADLQRASERAGGGIKVFS